MIHSVRFTVVLDTNVVYPITIRDILFWFAYYDLYTPKWSEHIFDEWKRVMREKGVTEKEASKRIKMANSAFPDALVRNYKSLIGHLNLPYPNCEIFARATIKQKLIHSKPSIQRQILTTAFTPAHHNTTNTCRMKDNT